MPTWTPFAIAAAIAAATVVANAAVSVQIKFAPDSATARKRLVALAFRVFLWVMNAGAFVVLMIAYIANEPVTMRNVIVIAVDVGGLVLAIHNESVTSIVGTMQAQTKLFSLLTDNVEKLMSSSK
jgi:hypothetical protein